MKHDPIVRESVARLQAIARLVACIVLVQFAAGLPILPLVDSVAAPLVPACASSGPESGAYALLVCLSAPRADAELSGDVTVSATVTVEYGAAPAIEHVQFFFTHEGSSQSAAVLRDYEEPYTFILPTERWADGQYRLETNVLMLDDFESGTTGMSVTTANGVTRMPRSMGRWAPVNFEGEEEVIVGVVGDGAGGLSATYDVANLITGWNPDMFLYLGDIYNIGSYTEFINYYEPTLGPLKAITNPVPGDHEGGRQFQGYMDYWDSSQHYYAVTAGNWRVYVINSTERFNQVTPGSIQYEWLRRELESTPEGTCTMVVSHFPRWGQSRHNDYTRVNDLWALMATENVDIVLGGHEHNYQRWTPMDAAGSPRPDGPTQFVVGTGGHQLTTYSSTDSRLVSNHQGTFGALRMVLTDGRADYQYIDTAGNVLDAGEVTCGDDPPEGMPTTTGATGTIVNTNGLRAMCLAAPDYSADTITLLPEGSQVELLGAQVGEWQPVRCADQDGFVLATLIEADG